MSLTNLLPSVQALPYEEKLRLLELLTADIRSEASAIASPLEPTPHSVWSPYSAYSVADVLLNLLAENSN